MGTKAIELTVISAKDLNNVRMLGDMRVYVEVSISGLPDNKHQTPARSDYGGSNPCWNHKLCLNFDERSAAYCQWDLILLLRDKSIDKDIGEVRLPLTDLISDYQPEVNNEPRFVTTPVISMPSREANAGELIISYIIKEVTAAAAVATAATNWANLFRQPTASPANPVPNRFGQQQQQAPPAPANPRPPAGYVQQQRTIPWQAGQANRRPPAANPLPPAVNRQQQARFGQQQRAIPRPVGHANPRPPAANPPPQIGQQQRDWDQAGWNQADRNRMANPRPGNGWGDRVLGAIFGPPNPQPQARNPDPRHARLGRIKPQAPESSARSTQVGQSRSSTRTSSTFTPSSSSFQSFDPSSSNFQSFAPSSSSFQSFAPSSSSFQSFAPSSSNSRSSTPSSSNSRSSTPSSSTARASTSGTTRSRR